MKADGNFDKNRKIGLASALIALFFMLCNLVACDSTKQIPKPPLVLPFVVQLAGNKVETELQVHEHRSYIFYLQLGFVEKDPEDRERVKKLAGDYERNKEGKLLKPGVAVPLRLKISVIDSFPEKTLLEREILEEEMWAYGADNFKKQIAIVPLKPGHYRVSLESLKDAPELVGTPIAFGIGFYAKATSIK
jgi:hypothetical protein